MIGQSIPRQDGLEKVTGRARNTGDLEIDPVQLRLKNMPDRGEIWLHGKKPLDADLASSLGKLTASIGRDSSTGPGPSPGNGASDLVDPFF